MHDQPTFQCVPAWSATGLVPRGAGDLTSATAVRVFPGTAGQAREARRWVRALTETACALAADDAELAAGELFANAVRHTRSGAPGGKITLVVAGRDDQVAVHVHDQGAGDGWVPRPATLDDERGLPDDGRGLSIVAALCAGWEAVPVARCPLAEEDDPAVSANGCCIWFRLLGTTGNDRQDQREAAGRAAVMAA